MRVVWYHDNCWDGFGAAYAVWKRFGYVGVVYQGVRHARPVPDLPNVQVDELWLLDFTYPRAEMERLRGLVPRMTVIDHHVTAERELEGFECETKIFDMEQSGSYLTFRYLRPDLAAEDVPLLFDYLQDRDLWRFELPHSRELNGYIKSFPYKFEIWAEIEAALQTDFQRCVQEGAAVLRLQKRTVEMICDQVRFEKLGDYLVPTVNATAFWSEVGEELLRRFPDDPFVASYYDRDDGTRYYSLRSPDRFDCSEVARKFGGGGHRKAASFTLEVESAHIARLYRERMTSRSAT